MAELLISLDYGFVTIILTSFPLPFEGMSYLLQGFHVLQRICFYQVDVIIHPNVRESQKWDEEGISPFPYNLSILSIKFQKVMEDELGSFQLSWGLP